MKQEDLAKLVGVRRETIERAIDETGNENRGNLNETYFDH
ncbi:helix-turn-helix domain-containing protein [bacterium 1XD21-13]|nr:helix-turn-helix domain-containing protein [bacterium 1XD21-13]